MNNIIKKKIHINDLICATVDEVQKEGFVPEACREDRKRGKRIQLGAGVAGAASTVTDSSCWVPLAESSSGMQTTGENEHCTEKGRKQSEMQGLVSPGAVPSKLHSQRPQGWHCI